MKSEPEENEEDREAAENEEAVERYKVMIYNTVTCITSRQQCNGSAVATVQWCDCTVGEGKLGSKRQMLIEAEMTEKTSKLPTNRSSTLT